ncbi:hypothetical protein SD37_26895 [Amycolatopsis orientalis]|uniref:Oxidoreductase n=1 Tax=Amycolatopsis orientalis TaxID=31958 RepID=A0A193C335_AMYOR|nr:Gfo/Idh/MocA family oxidoreductase [Amycolatopsis orientalis]ANN18892.1 hypothetical protein SD37_26895 [Amycolatopsis orientalis]
MTDRPEPPPGGWRLGILSGTGTALKRTIPALRNSKVCQVSVVHGRDPGRLRLAGRHAPNARLVTSEEEFAENAPHYDIVYIGSPPFLHLAHIALAGRLGKPIICEKPLVSNPADLDTLLTPGTRPRVPFMLAHQVRHQAAVDHVRSLLRGGELGRPVAASLQWCFQLNHEASNAAWKLDPALGGSALADCGVHGIDLALALFGRPDWVAATGHSIKSAATMDTTTLLMSCGGLPVTVVASQSGHPGANDLVITLSDGLIEARGMFGETAATSVVHTKGTSVVTRSFDLINLYRAEVEDYCAALSRGESAGTTLDEAVLAARVVFAAEESARTGAALKIDIDSGGAVIPRSVL